MLSRAVKRGTAIFHKSGGVLRTTRAINLGIHPRTLYQMRDLGVLEQVSRGVYRLASLPTLEQPDLITVATRIPRAVVCLVSALSYHDITTEIPHEVQIALPRGTKTPTLAYPPIRVFRFSGKSFSEGIQAADIGGVTVNIYGPAKTVADCFRFRNKLGLDVAIESLNLCLRSKNIKPAELLRYARICRVEKVMLPYLEARQ